MNIDLSFQEADDLVLAINYYLDSEAVSKLKGGVNFYNEEEVNNLKKIRINLIRLLLKMVEEK